MSGEADPRLLRLRLIPPRLRVAHLAALLRSMSSGSPRAAEREHLLSCPSPSELERGVGREGRSVAQAGVHPAHRSPSLTMIHPPHKREGSEPSSISHCDGRLE
jgi:hypothetical protein